LTVYGEDVSLKSEYAEVDRLFLKGLFLIAAVLVWPLIWSHLAYDLAYAQLWYNTQTDSAIECFDDEPGNPSPGPDLLGCPYDFMKHVGGSTMVGSWHIVNQTSDGSIDRNLTGIMTFNHNGTMQFVLPTTVVYDENGDKSNTVNGSWGVNNHRWLGICFEGNQCTKLTFTKKSHDHMELTDDHGDRIHLNIVQGSIQD
jgi:hypothetical protein